MIEKENCNHHYFRVVKMEDQYDKITRIKIKNHSICRKE